MSEDAEAKTIIPITEEITPDGLYEAFAIRMEANEKEADELWEKRERLLLATVYGCRHLGAFKRRKRMLDEKIAKHIRSIIWGIKGPDWKEMPPQLTLTRVAAFKGNNRPAPPPVWALIELPEGLTNEEFLKPSNRVRTDHDGMTVILAPFPWELNVTQHYKILHIAEEVLEEDIRNEVVARLGARITEKAQLTKRKDHKRRAIWNMTLTFDLGMVDVEPDLVEGPDQVVDMLGLHKR